MKTLGMPLLPLFLVASLAHAAVNKPVTLGVTNIMADRAEFTGIMMPHRQAARLGFQVRKVGARSWRHTTWQRVPAVLSSSMTFTGAIAQLKFDADYQARAVAVVGGLMRYGDIVTFHSSTGIPEFVSSGSTNFTSSNAVVSADFYPNSAATLAWFEWGTTTSYGNTTEPVSFPAGVEPQHVEAQLSSLVPDTTTYHWRAVLSNSVGVAQSADAAFIATDYVGIPEGYTWEFTTPLISVEPEVSGSLGRHGTVEFDFLPGSFSTNGIIVCSIPLPFPVSDLQATTTVSAPADGGALTAVGSQLQGQYPWEPKVRFIAERGSVVLTSLRFVYQEAGGVDPASTTATWRTNVDLRITR